MDYSDERTEEDHIIETLIVNGNKKLYEDLDFLPTRQSLYNTEKFIPEYDDDVAQRIIWSRPHEVHDQVTYFDSRNRHIAAIQGSLPDDVFLGALMAVCVYSKYDLIENLFASRPEDFVKYGVYTCRFYVDGEWVNVITDTTLPCERNNLTGEVTPVYGRSIKKNELWISLIEKSFAKAMGNYESISQIKLQRALLHLTGGSVQQLSLRDEIMRHDSMGDLVAWQEFKKRLQQDCIVLLLPEEWKKPSIYNSNTAAGELAPPGAEAPVPVEPEHTQKSDNFFIPNHSYSVVACRDVGGYELVLMHNPYQHPAYQWTGEWSDNSNDWDLYPELLVEIEKDPAIPWKRKQSNGYFWISFRTLVKYFNKMFVCLLFPNDSYHFYYLRGECRGRTNGGPLVTLRDKDSLWKEYHRYNQLAAISTKVSSIQPVIDGDASWFNNPQYRIHLPASYQATSNQSHDHNHHNHHRPHTAGGGSGTSNTPFLFVSVVPLGNGEPGSQDQADVGVDVVITPKHLANTTTIPINLWEITQCDSIVNDRHNTYQLFTKGQETSLWAIPLDPKHYYYIVPNTLRRERDGDFMLRIFCTTKVVVETIPSITMTSLHGEWKRVGDVDTTGGPTTVPPQPTNILQAATAATSNNTSAAKLPPVTPVATNPSAEEAVAVSPSHATSHHVKENSKWSQNPQFHVQLNQIYGNTEEVYLKIVVRKHESSHHHSKLYKQKSAANSGGTGGGGIGSSSGNAASGSGNNAGDEKKANATIGLTVVKADVYEENASKSKKKVPRQNKLGELIPTKESSLKPKKSSQVSQLSPNVTGATAEPKLILRKLHVHNNEYQLITTYEHKQEACVFYPRLPRSWFPNGLLVVPSLSEKGVRGKFDLEVYCSEPVTVTQLPETFARSIAGDWNEHTAGGSHIFPSSWKKNPKFLLHLHYPMNQGTGQLEAARVRITIARHGNNWKNIVKKDTVGCMIGFYLFIGHGHSGNNNTIGDIVQYFESTFVASDECITDVGFTLPPLHPDEYYVIMPTTFSEGKFGSFILSVMSEVEFQLVKES